MTHEIASVLCGKSIPKLAGTPRGAIKFYNNSDNRRSPAQAYQELLDECASDILIYVHSDLDIHDKDWLPQVLAPFESNDVAVVGLGGARTLGNADLYRKPYALQNMARGGYASNATDAEVHGERLQAPRRVSVLDAFFMAVRTDWLRKVGGWPTEHLTHHCLDLWIACEAARDSRGTWIVPVSFTHHGGAASVGKAYGEAKWLQGGSLQSDHEIPHRWLWDSYRDVLPLEVLDNK